MDLPASTTKRFAPTCGPLTIPAWSPSREQLAVGTENWRVFIWEPASGLLVSELPTIGRESRQVAWGSGELLAVITNEGLELRPLAAAEPSEPLPLTPRPVCCNWHPHRPLLAVGTDAGEVILYSAASRTFIARGHSPAGRVQCLGWAPRGDLLASGSAEADIVLWDEDLRVVRQLGGGQIDPTDIAWSYDGTLMAVPTNFGAVTIFSSTSGEVIQRLECGDYSVEALRFSAGGAWLVTRQSAGNPVNDPAVKLWRCDTWEFVSAIDATGDEFMPFGPAFHPLLPDRLAIPGNDGREILVLDLGTDRYLGQKHPPVDPLLSGLAQLQILRPLARTVRCFISYAHSAEYDPFLRRLMDALYKGGVEVLVDKHQPTGSDIPEFVEQGLAADHVIVVGTPLYLARLAAGSFIAREVEGVRVRLNQDQPVHGILLAGSPTDALPEVLRDRVYADCRNPGLRDAALWHLVCSVRGESLGDLQSPLDTSPA